MKSKMRIRTAPKYLNFFIIGLFIGVILTCVFSLLSDGSFKVFGFLFLIIVPASVAVFLIMALILDKILSKKSRIIDAEHIKYFEKPPQDNLSKDNKDILTVLNDNAAINTAEHSVSHNKKAKIPKKADNNA